tara:strand:- start:2171 stop:2587 length:417 start_codon:yes stop_codon:yes gene_type:complete
MADIYLNNSNIDFIDTFFDVEVDGNGLVTDDTLRTATLISIFTDASIPQIGTQIDGNTYGNKYYNISKLSPDNIKLYEKGLKDSLNWLIVDKIVEKLDIITEKKNNTLLIEMTFTLDSENTTNVIFNLDEQMKIMDKV